VSEDPRRARDLRLLDQVDAHPRRPYSGDIWRVVREGRDPLQGGRSPSRWCNGQFDVLYASSERDGAIAELHALLALQPVFPSKISFRVHRLAISMKQSLQLTDLSVLSKMGIDTSRYQEREYRLTQEIADAACFLGFDGLLVPSARWACSNCVLFTDRIAPAELTVEETEQSAIDWQEWRRSTRKV
jgi:RES domain-containing protein